MTSDDDSESAPLDPEKPLPDPPDNLNLFDLQRYVGKLTEWALESHTRERNRPKVVERDDGEPGES